MLDEDDNKQELRDLDEDMDEDGIHTSEKARQKQAWPKAKLDAEGNEENNCHGLDRNKKGKK